MLNRVDVDLGPRAYPVWIGAGCLPRLGHLVRDQGLRQEQAFVLTNPVVDEFYGDSVCGALHEAGFQKIVRHRIPASEEGKNWTEFTGTCAALLKHFPDAGSAPLVVLLGGGVVGDLGGFAAAVYRRGVPFVQVPTTLLAAVDSSVGGKVAVNFDGVKNIMGAFSQPRLVVCDLDALRTLPQRELRSGTSEVIKYGAVCSGDLFTHLEEGALEQLLALDAPTLVDVVSRCVRLKADVVQQDEFDKLGIRNVLNFGHTIGHAIELSAHYELTHGEAISIGMVAASRMALRLGVCEASFVGRLENLLRRAGLPLLFPGRQDLFDAVVRALQMDKKFRNGKNLFVFAEAPGKWRPYEDVDWGIVHEAIRAAVG